MSFVEHMYIFLLGLCQKKQCSKLHSQQHTRVPVAPHLHQHLILSLFNLRSVRDVERCLFMVLMYISLTNNSVANHLHILLAIWIHSFVKGFLSHLFIYLLDYQSFFFFFTCLSSLYIMDMSYMLNI